MANLTLIIGESGTGKSSSIRNLDPSETYLVNVLDKPLPFKGFKNKYQQKEGGNYACCDNSPRICKIIDTISKERDNIKNVIIDDFQYIMANEFMRRAKERGFDKFTEIAQNAWEIISSAGRARDDLNIFILSHSETSEGGRVKCKTIGKMLDEKITLEGMFTTVLHSLVIDGEYKFLTQNDGKHNAKSPMGMFEDKYIDNDLLSIKQVITNYFGE